MKNHYIPLLLCMIMLLNIQFSMAQCSDTTTVSTNVDNPINTQFDVSHQGMINPFLNTYNWSGVTSTGFQSVILNPNANWGAGYNTFLMNSPFSSAMGTDYSYLKYINGQYPTIAQLPELDWGWGRGWELMWMNSGYYPDGQEINNPLPNSIVNNPIGLSNELTPYIIVYNRYTGKLRLFANLITPFGSTNNIYSTFKYDKLVDVSGVFRNLNNYDRPLDMPTINLGATVYNKNDNNNALWYSNDIQLGYDPCVCSYATDINLELKGINTFDVNLYGREIQVEVPISQIEKNFLNQSSIETDGANGSNLIYKYTDKMYADYQKQLADYNTKLKDYNSIGNLLKSQVLNITKDLVTTGTGLIFPSKALKELIVNSAVTLNGKEFPDTTTAAGWAKAAKEASKSIMGKGFDHYTQGFVTSKPTAPTMPTATLSEMRISGTITQSNLVQISGLHTPGSFKPGIQALQPHSYPIYNKPVGLFALLQKPEIEYYDESMLLAEEVIKTAMCVKKIYGSFGQLKYDTAFKAPKSKVYRLENKLYLRIKEPLKYKYNDASGVDKEKTKTFVSFIVEYDGDNTYINYYKNWARPTYVESQGQRIVEGNLELMHDNVLLNNNNYISRTYESEWVNIAEVNQKVFGLGFIDSIINTALGTPTEPNSCEFLSDREWERQTKFKLKSIKMKLMTDMYFITNDDINTTQVFTYKIYDRNEPETQVAELTQVDDVSSIKQYNLGVIELNNEHIGIGHPLVSQINGSTLIVNVEKLIISGTLTTDPGFNLVINAQEKIEVKPEAEIAPETELIAYANFFSTPVFTEVSNSELQNYCSGSNKKYNANTATLTKKEESKPSVKTIKPPKIAVYPNPANTILNLNLPSDYSGNIELFDMLGKVVVSINVNQINKAVIDVSFLQNGIYILKVTINEVMQSQKIVIQH